MSTGTVWALIGLCVLTTALTRGLGPAATGDRQLPAPAVRVVVLLSSGLLAALVVTAALADGTQLHVGADTAGVATAGLLLWRRAHLLVAVLAAAAVTAGLRALGVD
jgi:branched-subunit amino acid transport protein